MAAWFANFLRTDSGRVLLPLSVKQLAAARILSKAISQDPAGASQIARAVQNSPIEVYIQIAQDKQRGDALILQAALRKEGFGTPGIELVSGGTIHTYVRYFASDNRANAVVANDVLTRLGLKSSIQDFSDTTQTPLRQIEAWIGKNEAALPSQ